MATEILRPNSAGDETSIDSQFPDSTSHYDKVDEAVADDGTTRVLTSSITWERDLYNLPASSGSGTINFIKIYFRIRTAGAGGFGFRPSMKSGTTVTDGTDVTQNFTWTTHSEQWSTNPDTSSAWTWDDIDTLQIGVSLKLISDPKECTQVYVEVDYTAGATYTLTASAGSFTQTGVAVSLIKSSLITLAKGTFTLTGSTINIAQQYIMTLASGTFTLTGNTLSLIKSSILTAVKGTYTLTGNSLSFIRSLVMVAGKGVYTLTGNDITFKVSLKTKWTALSKSATTFANNVKNATSFTNKDKSSTTWTNKDKN